MKSTTQLFFFILRDDDKNRTKLYAHTPMGMAAYVVGKRMCSCSWVISAGLMYTS